MFWNFVKNIVLSYLKIRLVRHNINLKYKHKNKNLSVRTCRLNEEPKQKEKVVWMIYGIRSFLTSYY